MSDPVMYVVLGGLILFVIFMMSSYIRIVPQRQAFIVERLGKYAGTLNAGFHILIPFIDRVAYKHTLKEQVIDVLPQTCITKDNIQVEVDGVLYMQVIDPQKASYGIDNYRLAAINMAQTTMRSVLGQMVLDRTFEERVTINHEVVKAVDEASEPWGVKVARYEVKNIVPPQSIKDAMEKQMKAEREKRAVIAESEGFKQSEINKAEGERQAVINRSEGEKQRRINEAEGQSKEIELVAQATADALRRVAEAANAPGGLDAVSLRIAEAYIGEFGKLAKTNNTMIIPSNLADLAAMVSVGAQALKSTPVSTSAARKEPKLNPGSW